MENQNAIVTQVKSAVMPWASRQDVRELGSRIKELMPGANKLQPHEALALAQAAVAHGLDPFNGEIWFIPGRGLMAGIKGHRRAGHNQMTREGGGNYWAEFRGPLSVDELAQIKAPTGALAYECRLYDSKNIMTYVEAVSKLTASGVPWEVVKSVMGDRPYTPGIGWYVPGESTKMTPPQVAQKRAEADALKRRFDLPFSSAVGMNGDSDEVAGDFTISTSESPADIQAKSQALYGDDGDLVTQAARVDRGPDWTEPPAPVDLSNVKEIPYGLNEQVPYRAPAPVSDKPAALKYQPFVTWCNEWVLNARAAKYMKEHAEDEQAQANMYHILKRVRKLGYSEVTEANVEEIKTALQKHVEVTE